MVIHNGFQNRGNLTRETRSDHQKFRIVNLLTTLKSTQNLPQGPGLVEYSNFLSFHYLGHIIMDVEIRIF